MSRKDTKKIKVQNGSFAALLRSAFRENKLYEKSLTKFWIILMYDAPF